MGCHHKPVVNLSVGRGATKELAVARDYETVHGVLLKGVDSYRRVRWGRCDGELGAHCRNYRRERQGARALRGEVFVVRENAVRADSVAPAQVYDERHTGGNRGGCGVASRLGRVFNTDGAAVRRPVACVPRRVGVANVLVDDGVLNAVVGDARRPPPVKVASVLARVPSIQCRTMVSRAAVRPGVKKVAGRKGKVIGAQGPFLSSWRHKC